MNYLELVQEAVRESGAKIDVPTTVVGQTGLSYKFVKWVQDAWKKIQMERLSYHFRVVTGQTLSLVADTAEYSLPSTLESINTGAVYTTDASGVKANLYFRPSAVYRSQVLSTNSAATGRPQYFTLLPEDGELAVWPTPDAAYTLNYEGQLRIQKLDMTDDTDTPQNLHADYHDGIVWLAVQRYAQHFEDGAKAQEAKMEYTPYKKYYEERYMDVPVVDTTILYASVYPYDA